MTGPLRKYRVDIAIALTLFGLAALATHTGNGQIALEGAKQDNVWFQADVGRVYRNMTDRWSRHYRTKVHPLFSITTNPPVSALSSTILNKQESVRAFISFVSGIWLVSIYTVLRLRRVRPLDATLFSLLAATSASAIFWTTVPETYVFGSVTILVVMGFVALTEHRAFGQLAYIAISALSLSMTVTNWMSGLIATLASNPLARSLRITGGALAAVTILWGIQKAIFPSSEYFLISMEERNYILLEGVGGPYEKAVSFFFHSMVMPVVQILPNPTAPSWPLFTVQFSPIGSTGSLGWLATVLWIGLFSLGSWAIWNDATHRKFKIVLLSTILGQLALHLVYGDETFLYSLHWTPLLVLVAAMASISPYRKAALTLVTALILVAGVNNFAQFRAVSSELASTKYGESRSGRPRLSRSTPDSVSPYSSTAQAPPRLPQLAGH